MAESVPLISYDALSDPSQGRGYQEAVDNLAKAMDPSAFGFFMLIETTNALPLELRRKYQSTSKELLRLPDGALEKYVLEGQHGQRGITPFGTETGVGATVADPK